MRAASGLLAALALFFPLAAPAAPFDFSDYGALLERYVTVDRRIDGIAVNLIDYAAMQREQYVEGSDWRRLLQGLERFDPEGLAGNEGKAFWINVYNIAAIEAILAHYPVESIRSRSIRWLKQPWKKLGIVVGGEFYSLHRIEFEVLIETYRDLRIHFGINCASLSCPDLRPEPYLPEVLDRQLDEQGERFARQRSKGLEVDRQRNVVRVSQIFRFDREHFDAWAGGAIPFLLSFVKEEGMRAYLRQGAFELEYLDYDWSLNGLPPTGASR